VYVACLACLAEPFETLFEQGWIRVSTPLPREHNLLSMHTLKGVEKRWSVVLLHHVLANLNDVVGPDAEDVRVERTGMYRPVLIPRNQMSGLLSSIARRSATLS
jgi:hypothetical protein